LDGQGGDEVLLGYERYYFHYMKTLNFFEKISFLNLISQQSRNSFLKNIVYYFYFNFPIIRRNYYKTKIPNLKKNLYKEVDFLKAEQKIGHGMNTKMLQKSELFQYQLPHLLKYEDKNSMYHSIESRLPFLDFDLVEVASNCSDRLKMKDGWSKYILRKAFENTLPKEIIWRKDKKGFEAPEDIWLKDRSHFTETIENSKFMAGLLDKGKISDSLDNKALWRLYSLALWAEIFNVE
jgi:asparagine synthase (glutamine-hydrolysing)